MGDPTSADVWLAGQISRRLGVEVSPRQTERLREAGLVRLHRPGSHERRGRQEGCYLPPMVGQGVAAVLGVKQERNFDRVGMRLFLAGWDISPAALRRYFLGTPSKPARFGREPSGDQAEGGPTKPKEKAASRERLLLRRIMGEGDLAFLGFLAALAEGDDAPVLDPNPALAVAMGLDKWASPVDYDSRSGRDGIELPPPEAVEAAQRLQRQWLMLVPTIEESDEEDWISARSAMWAAWSALGSGDGAGVSDTPPDPDDLLEAPLALEEVAMVLAMFLLAVSLGDAPKESGDP